MPCIFPIGKSYNERKGKLSPIGNSDRLPTSGTNVPTSGGGPFSASGKDPLRGGGNGPLRDKNPRIHIVGPIGPWVKPTWNPWYPLWYLIQPLIAPNPSPSREFLPYPIYNARMDPNTHIRMFHKAIHTNGEKINVDVVNLFYFTFHDAISEWGEKFLQTHPICKFEKLQIKFCRHVATPL